jgi:hypothetical protein
VVHIAAGLRGGDRHADAETLVYDMNSYAETNSRFPLDIEIEYSGGEGI